MEAAENGADCLGINPGNIGSVEKINEVIEAAKQNNIPIRVGVNAGSLEKQILEKYKSPTCLLYTSPSPRDGLLSRMPSSA